MSSASRIVTLRPRAGDVQRPVRGVDRRHRGARCRRAARRPRRPARRCPRRPGRRSRGSRAARRGPSRLGRITYCTGIRNGARSLRPDHRHRLQVPEQRRPVVPGGALRALDDVVADQRRDRDRHDGVVREAQRPGERGEVLGDRGERLLVVVDQVDLVDGQHQPRHAQQREHGGVPAGLLDDAVAGVDEQDGQLRGGRAGDRVAGVLDVPGGVGEHELALRAWRSSGRRRRS